MQAKLASDESTGNRVAFKMYGSSGMGNVCVGNAAAAAASHCSVSRRKKSWESRAGREKRSESGPESPKNKKNHKNDLRFFVLCSCSDGHGLRTSGATAEKWTAAEEVSSPSPRGPAGSACRSSLKPNQGSL